VTAPTQAPWIADTPKSGLIAVLASIFAFASCADPMLAYTISVDPAWPTGAPKEARVRASRG
jgi:hypothetical protein